MTRPEDSIHRLCDVSKFVALVLCRSQDLVLREEAVNAAHLLFIELEEQRRIVTKEPK